MNLHIYDRFSEDSADWFSEDSEASNFKLYANRKDFQTVFSDNIFGKEGKFFFPGTLEEAHQLIDTFALFKDTEDLFSAQYLPSLFKKEVENWSYSELACSTLYYSLNTTLVTDNLTSYDWKEIAELIKSPVLSRDILSFVNKHNLIAFSSRKSIVLGILSSLIFPSSISVYRKKNRSLPYVKGLYRLLKLSNVEKSVIRISIKTSFNEQNLKAIVKVLNNEVQVLAERDIFF